MTQQTDTFTTAGTFTWTCPAGVISVDLAEVTGAGGSGMANNNATGYNGGGGGGGEYAAAATIAVTPGTGYTVVVGAGGPAKRGSNGVNGGDSSVTLGATVVTGHGGHGGTSSAGQGVGGAGGTGSTNPTHHNGGAGANGLLNTRGGGGGGSGGTSVAGNPGSAGSGGAAVTGGGAGGNAGTTTNGTGLAGGTPGGGGGGAYYNGTDNTWSGAGADGQVKLTYTLPAGGTQVHPAAAAAAAASKPVTKFTGGTLGKIGAYLDPAVYGADQAGAVTAWETKTGRALGIRVSHYGVIPASASTDDPASSPTLGVALHGSSFGTVSATSPMITDWTGAMGGRPLLIRHRFLGSSIPSSYAASPFNGEAGVRKILCDIEPAADGSQRNTVDAFMASCAAAGLDMDFTIYHAMPSKFSTVADYKSAVAHYADLPGRHGFGHIYDLNSWQAIHLGLLDTWWPTGVNTPSGTTVISTFTAVGIEYYANGYFTSAQRLDDLWTWADGKGLPAGLTEYGAQYDAVGGTDPDTTLAQGVTFFGYVRDQLAARINASKPMYDVLCWNNAHSASGDTPGFVITNQPAQWIAIYEQIHDLMTKSTPGHAWTG